jgi:hypothetical protein
LELETLACQDVAYGKRFNGYVLFALVGVHGGFAADGGIQFLDIGGGRFHDGAVGLANASVEDVQGFKTGSEVVDQQAKFVNGGFGLDTRAKR